MVQVKMVLVREMDMEIALGTVRARDREMVLSMVRTKIDREEGFVALANC
jgi:hypothetical protein